MVKSTPISQLPVTQNVNVKHVQHNDQPVVYTEEINLEDLVREKDSEKEAQEHSLYLQNQIDSLKEQIGMNNSVSTTMNTIKPPVNVNTSITNDNDSIINKNLLNSIMIDVDYKLFLIAVVMSFLMYSETVQSFIFSKLETKHFGYLTSYLQSLLLSFAIVMIMRY